MNFLKTKCPRCHRGVMKPYSLELPQNVRDERGNLVHPLQVEMAVTSGLRCDSCFNTSDASTKTRPATDIELAQLFPRITKTA